MMNPILRKFNAPLLPALLLGAALLSAGLHRAHGAVVVDGTTVDATHVTGTSILTSANGYSTVRVLNKGSLTGVHDWSLNPSGTDSYGIELRGTSTFSGSNVRVFANSVGMFARGASTLTVSGFDVTTLGTYGYAIAATERSTGILTNGTITTRSTSGYGFCAYDSSTLTGSNLTILTTGSLSYGAVGNNSTTVNLTDVTVDTEGTTAYGLYSTVSSLVTGTNVAVHTIGSGAYGAIANKNSTLRLTGGSVTTEGDGSAGLYASTVSDVIATGVDVHTSGSGAHGLRTGVDGVVEFMGGSVTTQAKTSSGIRANSGIVTAKEATFNVAGDLVTVNNSTDNGSSITLDTVSAANGANVFQAEGAGGMNTLTVLNSELRGNLSSTSGTTISVIKLKDDTSLTGAASINSTSVLEIGVDHTSRWTVTADSTASYVVNNGILDLATHGARLTLVSNDPNEDSSYIQGGNSLLVALTEPGETGANVTADYISLTGALELTLADPGSLAADTFFVILLNMGEDAIDAQFDGGLYLNGTEVSTLWTSDEDGRGGSFNLNGIDYALSYTGNAATGELTGGNDMILQVQAVPEPSTYAMMLGGFGVLALFLRRRAGARAMARL